MALLVAGAYANSLTAGFVLDNRALILENPHLRAASWDNLRTILTHDYWHPFAANGLYRPLTTLSYLFNYSVLGNADRPAGYHVINLILHWACAVSSFALMRQLGAALLPAALAAALFALHPITTEAVTNIVGRADLLAALAVLVGLLSHVQAASSRGASRRCWLALLTATALMGVCSKENAVVLLPLIIAWELIQQPVQPWPHRQARLAASVAISVSVVCVMLAAGAWVRADTVVQASTLDNPILSAGFWAGRATAIEVMGLQIWQLLFPAQLSADYSYNQIPIVTWPPGVRTLAAWMTVAGVAAAAIWLRTRMPAVAFLIVFFFMALLPTANLVWRIGSIRADRFLYLPLVGFAGGLTLSAWQLARTARRRRVLTAVFGIALVLSGWRTIVRNRDWDTEESLWRSAVGAAPNSAKAHKGYATALFARPECLAPAIAHATRAIDIRPEYVGALLDLGGYYVVDGDRLVHAGDTAGANGSYTRAVALLRSGRRIERAQRPANTGSVGLYHNLMLAHLGRGDIERALVAARYARRIDPWHLQTYVDMSGLEARRGRWDDAAIPLFQVVELQRTHREAWTRLAELYRIIEPGSAAIVVDAGGVDVNEHAPLVQRHRCRAHAELARIFARAGITDVAQRARAVVHARPCSDLARMPGFFPRTPTEGDG